MAADQIIAAPAENSQTCLRKIAAESNVSEDFSRRLGSRVECCCGFE